LLSPPRTPLFPPALTLGTGAGTAVAPATAAAVAFGSMVVVDEEEVEEEAAEALLRALLPVQQGRGERMSFSGMDASRTPSPVLVRRRGLSPRARVLLVSLPPLLPGAPIAEERPLRRLCFMVASISSRRRVVVVAVVVPDKFARRFCGSAAVLAAAAAAAAVGSLLLVWRPEAADPGFVADGALALPPAPIRPSSAATGPPIVIPIIPIPASPLPNGARRRPDDDSANSRRMASDKDAWPVRLLTARHVVRIVMTVSPLLILAAASASSSSMDRAVPTANTPAVASSSRMGKGGAALLPRSQTPPSPRCSFPQVLSARSVSRARRKVGMTTKLLPLWLVTCVCIVLGGDEGGGGGEARMEG
jgi:hypothetical protein